MIYPDMPQLTIRRSTAGERKEKFPPIVRGQRRIRVPKHVVVAVAHQDKHMFICSVFGLPQGGDTRPGRTSRACYQHERRRPR